MRVETRPAVTSASAGVARRGAGGASFSLGGTGDAARASASAATRSLAGVDSLILLQGEEEPGERRRRSLRRGHDLLDALDRLKVALLTGAVPMADLKRIAATLRDRAGASGDAGLDEVLAHIDLRAQVELAKLGRA